MLKYSWIEESRSLFRKIMKKKKNNKKKFSDAIEIYWSDIATKQGIKGTN